MKPTKLQHRVTRPRVKASKLLEFAQLPRPSGSGESWFEPRRGNSKVRRHFGGSGLFVSTPAATASARGLQPFDGSPAWLATTGATLLQGFTGITLQLRAIERMLAQRPQESAEALKNVLASADTALRDARHMIWDMRAVELEGRDLAEALEMAARQAMADSSAELVFEVLGDRRRLPLAVETTALRVGREAVLNAVKHAAPRTVEVTFEYGPRSLTLRVVDDGTGIPPGALDTAAAGEHLGIAGMRERAQRAGGKLDITSEPDHGTIVSASLPIRETAGP
jgi:signal transduction histidine kinase